MSTSFSEWLAVRDPELVERFGLETIGKGAKWMAKKGLPFAVQAGMSLSDPISIMTPPKPDMPISPNRDLGVNMDDHLAAKAEKRRLQAREAAKRAAFMGSAIGKRPNDVGFVARS